MVRYVTKEQALDSPLRQEILRVAGDRPGVNMKGLADHLGVQPSTVIWHAAMLQRAGLLRTEKVAGLRVFYLPGQQARVRSVEAALLHHEAARRIRQAVEVQPGATFAGLASTLGLNAAALRWHVRRLVQGGLLCQDRQGRLAILYPGDAPGSPCRHAMAGQAAAASA